MNMVATQAGVTLESLEYHSESDTHRARYDRGTTPPSLAVVASLSEVLDAPPDDLEQLHDAVDGDALNELLRTRKSTAGEISVRFTVEGRSITVRNDGVISITPSERDEDGSGSGE